MRGLLERGEDVYIIDWGYPDRSDRYLELEDYIQRFLGGAVDHLRREYRLDAINLLGICQGGAFSLCYAALHPEKVRNLITMVTPVDFHTDDNMLSNWTRGMDVDLFVDTLGNVPADLMNWCYLTLKPWRLFVQKYVGLVDILDDKKALEDFLRMEKWIFDSPDQAGEAFRQFVKQFYQAQRLRQRRHRRSAAARCDLRIVDMPVLNIYRRAGPPGAAGRRRRRCGPGRQRRLQRAVVQGRPHRHLRVEPRAAGSAARRSTTGSRNGRDDGIRMKSQAFRVGRWVLAVLCLQLALPAAGAAAPPTPAPTPAHEIEQLIAGLGASGCDFQRNGSWYPPTKAEAHLRRKYEWLRERDLAATAEQFIERARHQEQHERPRLSGTVPGTAGRPIRGMAARAVAGAAEARPALTTLDWLRPQARRHDERDAITFPLPR